MEFGKIYKAIDSETNDYYHPFVFLGYKDQQNFWACVFTHDRIHQHIRMCKSHFVYVDKIADDQQFFQDQRPTHVVKTGFIKPIRIVDDTPIAEMTKEGLLFLKMNITSFEEFPHSLLEWENYSHISYNGADRPDFSAIEKSMTNTICFNRTPIKYLSQKQLKAKLNNHRVSHQKSNKE